MKGPYSGQYIPLLHTFIQGHIGKEWVIKHYRKGRRRVKYVKTKYPDMANIKPSFQQKLCRGHFKKAVEFAQKIYRNPRQKALWQRKLRKKWRLFQALMKVYFNRRRDKRWAAEFRLNRWKRNIQTNGGVPTCLSLYQPTQERLLSQTTLTHYSSLITHPLPNSS